MQAVHSQDTPTPTVDTTGIVETNGAAATESPVPAVGQAMNEKAPGEENAEPSAPAADEDAFSPPPSPSEAPKDETEGPEVASANKDAEPAKEPELEEDNGGIVAAVAMSDACLDDKILKEDEPLRHNSSISTSLQSTSFSSDAATSRPSASPSGSPSSSKSPYRSGGEGSRSLSARTTPTRPQDRRSRSRKRMPKGDRTPARRWPAGHVGRKGGKGNGRFNGGKGKRCGSRSPGRARSRTPACGSRRMDSNRGRTACWFGRFCKRKDCWFGHPEGRFISPSPRTIRSRGRSQVPRRGKTSAKASRSPTSSSSPSRRPRRASPSVTRNKRAFFPVNANKRAASSESRDSSAPASRSCSRDANTADEAPCPSTPPQSADSFRRFVWHCLDDAVTPDQAVAKFQERRRIEAEKDLELLKGSGLLFDLYNPLALARGFDLRMCTTHRHAETFLKDLHNGRYSGLSLRASTTTVRNGVCPTAGHMVAPHFAFDPDAAVLWLSGIPPAVSVWDIHDNLQSQPGFLAISMPRPQNGILRDVRMRFSSLGHARAALNTLSNAQLKEGYKMRPALVDTAPTLEALVVPPEMSNSERILKDVELCARVVRKLDALTGVPAEVTEAFVTWLNGADAEARLDLQLVYLRRVHHFCFYGCAWCDDEWELRRRCGAALLRGEFSKDGPAAAEGDWSQAHQQRIESFLEGASLKRPAVLSLEALDEEPFKGRFLQESTANMKQVTPEKFQCTLCRKFFKGPHYVHKHHRKVHVTLLEAVRGQVLQEESWAGYLADQNRPKESIDGCKFGS